MIYNWIHLRPYNGLTCRFWTDNWSPFGSLKTFLQLGASSSLGISSLATLASLFSDNSWRLPLARSETQVQLHAYLTTIVLNNEDDFYEIIGWGLSTSPLCLLCNVAAESRDHIFFNCPYAWGLWSTLAPRCGVVPARSWTSVMTQLSTINRRSPKGVLTLLCWQGCLYWTWTERNARLHRNTFRTVDTISHLFQRQIRDRILSFRTQNPALSSAMMQQWLS
ncbi:hypothetical protein N665_0730s0030 [Sinapis alba]|nr:hypothetical protein N665_0730s0030 [Sinapis alba]